MENRKVELLPLNEAIKNSLKINWANYDAPVPNVDRRQVIPHIPVEEIVPFIDWKFFFHSWNLSARYYTVQRVDCPGCEAVWLSSFPESEREKAEEGLKLYRDANAMLRRLILEKAGYIKAVFGIFKAYSDNESIYVNGIRIPFLRQQKKKEEGAYLSLCDYIMPRNLAKDDYIGAFAVTAGAGADELLSEYERQGDEYNVLLLKSVLDRLAEAATEYLHAEIRKKYWKFVPDENISIEDMFSLKYRGIRPAVGYPSIPDQSINFLLNNDLLHSEEIGIQLTENGVMLPNASVSGFIFAHPEAKYFNVGQISEEQAKAYISRRGGDPDTIRKFLAANL
jgi:5-methyltetrahydrofolate--homocysteine methyltransferase